MSWYVEVEQVAEDPIRFEFDSFEDAIKFVELWEKGCPLRSDYKLKRSDI